MVKESDAHGSWYEIPGRVDAPHSAGQVPVDMGSITESLGGRVAETTVQAEERMLQQATDYLNHIGAHFFLAGSQTKSTLGDNPAEEIGRYAQQQQVDLIAMATHGRTGIGGVLMGSVVRDLLHSAQVPLLLLRPVDFG